MDFGLNKRPYDSPSDSSTGSALSTTPSGSNQSPPGPTLLELGLNGTSSFNFSHPALLPSSANKNWSSTNGEIHVEILNGGGSGVEGAAEGGGQEGAARTDGQPPSKKKRVIHAGPPPPPGSILTEKSCQRCRARKVKCDRIFPVCKNCKDRKEEALCDLATLLPKDKPSSTMSAKDAERFARLEKRLAELESQVTQPSTSSTTVSTPAHAVPFESLLRPPNPPPPLHETPEEAQRAKEVAAFLKTLPDSPEGQAVANIGQQSLDWRLATPLMAQSLSQHLCDAFFESCCFLLPAFTYFRNKLPDYRTDPTLLDAQNKISVTVFCAVGARASPHSALLGIAASPDDSKDHPEAPLLSAGNRRQNACSVLVNKAFALCNEQGVQDEPTEENLAALLALMQMSIFVELAPKRSRTLLRSALGHFRDLQDMAETPEEKSRLKRLFALAIYHGDALTAPASRRSSLISDEDLRKYFDHVGIVIPKLPDMELTPILVNLFTKQGVNHGSLKTAAHLLLCWTCGCQRLFSRLVSPAARSFAELLAVIPILWKAVDSTRSAIQHIQTVIFNAGTELSPVEHSHSHTHGGSAEHHAQIHETDYLSQIIRLDRDLLDLISIAHTILAALPSPDLAEMFRESTSRVRKGLKTQAFYCKIYIAGADAHMIYHHIFQLEHNPLWAEMALQQVGDPGGPADETEAVTDVERSWFVEGLQHACFYTPMAEKRLGQLSPKFEQLEPTPAPSPAQFSEFFTADTGIATEGTSTATFDDLFASLDGSGFASFGFDQFNSMGPSMYETAF